VLWFLISMLLVISGLLLHSTLRSYEKRLKAELAMSNRNEDLKKMVSPLESQPQSGFWINCRAHGNLPLTKDVYDLQCKIEKYTCPFCGEIPRKIWRNNIKG